MNKFKSCFFDKQNNNEIYKLMAKKIRREKEQIYNLKLNESKQPKKPWKSNKSYKGTLFNVIKINFQKALKGPCSPIQ